MPKTVYFLADAVIEGDFQYVIVPIDVELIDKIRDSHNAATNLREGPFDWVYTTYWWKPFIFVSNHPPVEDVNLFDIWEHKHYEGVELSEMFEIPTVVDCPEIDKIIEKNDDDRILLDYKHLIVYKHDIAWSYSERFTDMTKEGLTTSIPITAFNQTRDYLKTKEKEQEWRSNGQ